VPNDPNAIVVSQGDVRSVAIESGDVRPLAVLGSATVLVFAAAIVPLLMRGRFAVGVSEWLMAAVVVTAVNVLVAPFMLARLRRVTVGTDGVFIADALGRSRFVPHRSLRAVAFDGRDLVVETRRGVSRYPLRPRRDDADEASSARRRSELARRVADIRALGLGGGTSNAALALRASASDLSEIIDRGSYRDQAVSRDMVWAIVEDPAAPPRARVQSAVALRVSAEEAPRLRAAAAATADPDVQRGLVAAGEIGPADARQSAITNRNA